MGQNVARPTDDILPVTIMANMSNTAIPDVLIPMTSVPQMVGEAIRGAGFSQTAKRKIAIFAVADAVLTRCLDVFVAALLLVATSPLLLLISLLVSLDGGRVFFGHVRLGKSLRSFTCFKFRTMIPNAETTLAEYLELNPDAAVEWARDQKLAFDVRVTPAGRFLRKTSLDELPQLWNVLRGDMSLVGPRPITAQEGQRYGASLNAYAGMRPGLTGLWQVSGRNAISYQDRVDLDTHYARHRNIWTDLSILLIDTPKALLSRRGAR